MTASAPDEVAIGLDVGGTKILGLAVSGDGAVVAERRRDTAQNGDELLEAVSGVADALATEAAAAGRSVVGLGVGVPGLVDRAGLLRFAPNLLGANGTQIAVGVAERLERLGRRWPLAVDNDATCAMAGEQAFGAAQGCDDALMVTVGTGIGGGIVAGGQLLRGAHNFSGEIGHVIIDPHGVPCPCGHRGCWERYASGSGLGRLGRDAAEAGKGSRLVELAGGDPDAVRGEHVVAAATAGDAEAAAVLGEFAWWLGLGLANLANILDPEIIVIGGGLATLGELLLEPTRAAFAELVERGSERTGLRLVTAELGEYGGAIGAAANGLAAARGR